jgi:dimethylamine monooxygenase subunit A
VGVFWESGAVLAQYLVEGPYRFSMAFQRGSFAQFYGATGEHEAILGERRRWLAVDAAKYLAVTGGAEDLLREAVALGVEHGSLPRVAGLPEGSMGLARYLGEHWEADYLLLRRAPDEVRLVCGCVCFPSSWALEEKIGKRIEEIHGVVPALNPTIGKQIQTFLERLKPGVSWMRSNWGLSRSAERNQHPSRRIPRLDESVALDEVFFRVEEQSLVALPESNGILFGIRLKIIPLRGYAGSEEGRRLAEALDTMPEAMARYKGLGSARGGVIELLKG